MQKINFKYWNTLNRLIQKRSGNGNMLSGQMNFNNNNDN